MHLNGAARRSGEASIVVENASKLFADLYTAISGIGHLVVRSASTYRVDKMFVPIVTLGLLGITLDALLRFAERRVAPWTAAAERE